MLRVASPGHCITYSLLVIPPLLLTAYLLAAFPSPPRSLYLHPGLSSLPTWCPSWDIYPESYYPGGSYAPLPHGKIRHWLMGPEAGKKIVLIGGLSVPSIIWRAIAPALAENGYRVLLYDLPGRGYSDAPETVYNADFYSTQLALLMQYVQWEKAVVMGVSMGGGIAAHFTASFPNLVEDKVILICPTGVMQSEDFSRTSKFMSSPLVQTIASTLPVRKYLQRLTNSSIPSSPQSDPIQEIVRLQSAYLPGYIAALSSSLRHGPIRGLENAFKSAAFQSRDVLIFHGTRDTTVPYKYTRVIQSLLPPNRSQLVTLEGEEHDLTVSAPEAILIKTMSFLS